MSRVFPTLYVVQAAKLTATYAIPEVKALLALISALIILTFIYNGIAGLAIGGSERMIKKSGVEHLFEWLHLQNTGRSPNRHNAKGSVRVPRRQAGVCDQLWPKARKEHRCVPN
jgi:hypothetical protein